MGSHRSKKAAAAAFAWGVFASDIPCIVRALEFAAATCGQSGRTSVFAWGAYNDLYNRLSLRNAIWVPTERAGVDSLPLPTGVIAGGTDGHHLYLLQSASVRIVDLSRQVVAIDARARDVPLARDCAALGITVCRNWALVAGPTFLGVYSLPAFERTPIARRSRDKSPTWPFTSDGYFIYALKVKKRRVDVFAITKNPDIVYQRSVVLSCPSHFIDDGFCCCCSGSVFTICVPKGQDHDRMVYSWGSFSVIDGSLINECSVRLPWPINGLFIDPWNRVIWEISNSTKGVNLIKLPIYCSHPPALGGFDVANVSKGDFDGIKTTKQMFLVLLNFLSYFYSHLFGASFRSVIQRKIYDSVTARFFGKCTADAINTIISAIQGFIKIYRNGRSDALEKGNVIRGLMVLMQCLDFNLSNYDVRKQSQNETINSDSILDFLSSILNDPEFGFLHRLTAFVIVNSFAILYETPSEKKSTVFVTLYERMPPDFLCFMINAVHLTDQFAYAISSRDCRNVFSPILKRMELLQPLLPNQKEFISCFMRSLVLEMRRVYSESSLQLTPKPKFLSDTFMAFASIMSEAVVHFFDQSADPEKLSTNPLINLYSKGLVLLEPFSGFSRASREVTSY
jgi:hypothetical protein